MPQKGWKSILIREGIYNKLQEKYIKVVEREKNIIEEQLTSFTYWVNNYLLDVIEEDELLSKYAPALSFIGVEGNTIFIKDDLKDRIVEVKAYVMPTKILWCEECNSSDCLHVGFSFAIKEVNRILIERGFKRPKVD